MSAISILLVLVVAFIAGMGGILDQFQFHQPLVACTLIGLATGNAEAITASIILGGTLQMIALGWANIGAAVAPDVSLASVASAIILIKSGNFQSSGITAAYTTAIPLAVAGLALTMVVRTISVGIVHTADRAAQVGNIGAIKRAHIFALVLQGLRVAIPAGALILLSDTVVQNVLNSIPEWLNEGMAIGGGMVVAVGYAMVINMMASREVWPFFALGFVFAALSELTLIGLGVVGVAMAFIYLNLSKKGGSVTGTGGSADPIGDILEDY